MRPWFSEDIHAAKRLRRKAERRWNQSNLQVHLEMLRSERVNVNLLCTEAKRKFYQEKINANSSDQKALFKIANELLHKSKDNSLPIHDCPETLANSFANYFRNKIEMISETFQDVTSEQEDLEYGDPSVQILSALQPISEDKLKKIIMSGNSKHCHLDPIPNDLIKNVLDGLLPVLTKIVNTSMATSVFPTNLKAVTVVPLLKKKTLDKEDFKNYQPVSNLTYVSKLIERVAVEQLNDHLLTYNLHGPCQSAYRRFHSTETALVKITNDLLCTMDKRQCALLVMLDLSAAFDTVSHDILFKRLESKYGITNQALSWMKSYFDGRTQSVIKNGHMSEPHYLKTGLPQGSILGPFQFTLYSSPLFDIACGHGIEVHMYTDDTQLYLPFCVKDYEAAM